MAKNDVILLDGIIDQRLSEGLPSSERDEVFEFFVLEEMLKDYDLSRDEIESGWVDGRSDGGLDGVYILINGHLLEDPNEFVWPRSHASIDVWLITCKHHATFQQATLDGLLATIQEFFDLSRNKQDLHGTYSEELLAFRNLLETTLRRLSIGRPKTNFNIIYASRGDTTEVGDSVAARGRQIEAEIPKLFSSCSARFRFTGACELVELHRKSKTFSLDLPFLEHLATGKDSYVLLVRLEDYWRFVSDESANLRRYLFDSNVRDFLGAGGVNEDIARSLADEAAPDFWWLNNGVTILATNATVPGKTIQLQDIQIVNGLQTTETIFRHFQSGSSASRDRALLVKILVSSDTQARDRIIRATNNQSPVELAALHATDKIQRDIEEILERHDWYYERRKNYYRNIGKQQSRFITPLYLASAVVSLLLRNPSQATRLKSKFMRNQIGYNSVFSESIPIEIWPILANVYKSVDAGLLIIGAHIQGEKFVRNWRPLIAFLIVARRMKTFAYSVEMLLEMSDKGTVKESEVAESWEFIKEANGYYNWHAKPHNKLSFVQTCAEKAAVSFGLSGIELVGRRGIKGGARSAPHTGAFLNQVDSLLPIQPWKQGVHIEIAKKLKCKYNEVTSAIQQLMAEGKRQLQIDGVVYDSKGAVLATDPDRISTNKIQIDQESTPGN